MQTNFTSGKTVASARAVIKGTYHERVALKGFLGGLRLF